MDVRDYKEQAKQAALRAGPGILRVFAVYVGVLAVLNVLIYFLETPFYDWSVSVRQYVAAGDFDVPLPSNRVRYGIWFSLLLTLACDSNLIAVSTVVSLSDAAAPYWKLLFYGAGALQYLVILYLVFLIVKDRMVDIDAILPSKKGTKTETE